MATSSIVGGSRVPEEVTGKDMGALGPSDNTDSGSDAKGAYPGDVMSSDTDAAGTGESAAIDPGGIEPDADILPDHLEPLPGAGTAEDSGPDIDGVQHMAADMDDGTGQEEDDR